MQDSTTKIEEKERYWFLPSRLLDDSQDFCLQPVINESTETFEYRVREQFSLMSYLKSFQGGRGINTSHVNYNLERKTKEESNNDMSVSHFTVPSSSIS